MAAAPRRPRHGLHAASTSSSSTWSTCRSRSRTSLNPAGHRLYASRCVVRLAWNDQVLVKRVLDAGAQTIMLPFVQTAEEARQAVSFAHYPPEGVRGVAAVHRGSRFGRVPDYLKRANDEVAVIVQLETPEAVERLPEIAAVQGMDALFIGPGDLAAAMGHIGNIAHPEVQALIARAARRARRRQARRHRRSQPRYGAAVHRYGYGFGRSRPISP